jgi:hypothetical protein
LLHEGDHVWRDGTTLEDGRNSGQTIRNSTAANGWVGQRGTNRGMPRGVGFNGESVVVTSGVVRGIVDMGAQSSRGNRSSGRFSRKKQPDQLRLLRHQSGSKFLSLGLEDGDGRVGF